jgi:hypothetical protein
MDFQTLNHCPAAPRSPLPGSIPPYVELLQAHASLHLVKSIMLPLAERFGSGVSAMNAPNHWSEFRL